MGRTSEYDNGLYQEVELYYPVPKQRLYIVTYKTNKGEIKQTEAYAESIYEAKWKAKVLFALKNCSVIKVKYNGVLKEGEHKHETNSTGKDQRTEEEVRR